jgi:hypothetical protein
MWHFPPCGKDTEGGLTWPRGSHAMQDNILRL